MTLKFISYSDDWDVAIIYNAVHAGTCGENDFFNREKI